MSYNPPVPSLVFPPPPAAPQRSASVASSATYQSVATIGEEPTVDALRRDAKEVAETIEQAEEDLGDVEQHRDTAISNGSAESLQRLAALTTATGQKILAVYGPLASLRARVETLAALAEEGRAAATKMELANVTEEIEVLQLSAKKVVESIRALAWEEAEARGVTKNRLEQRIRRENPTMNDDGVKLALRQAESGAAERIANLDILSYAGRLAAEQPFTELARVLKTLSAAQGQAYGDDASIAEASAGHGLVRSTSDASARTLVGSGYQKLDHDLDLENAPLAKAAAGGVDLGAFSIGDDAEWGPSAQKTKKRFDVRANWKAWLVRGLLVTSVLAVVIGLMVYEIRRPINNKSGSSNASQPPAVAGAIEGPGGTL